jgi:hypothetical protein
MSENNQNPSVYGGSIKSVTLRRDGKGPLKFTGERIGAATRRQNIDDDNGEQKSYEISARLFRTSSGKYIAGVEVYNKTDEQYDTRDGWCNASLVELSEAMQNVWLDDDIRAELFEKTEIADQFIETVD